LSLTPGVAIVLALVAIAISDTSVAMPRAVRQQSLHVQAHCSLSSFTGFQPTLASGVELGHCSCDFSRRLSQVPLEQHYHPASPDEIISFEFGPKIGSNAF
jgi:hypothetical protein